MIACLLDPQTKVVVRQIILNSLDEWIPEAFPNEELAPQHDGEIGWKWTESGWSNPNSPTEEQFYEKRCNEARAIRDKYLRNYVDVFNGPRWESLSAELKQSYVQYRQDLLDVPQQAGFPDNINWPVKPE
jgi:hypothetical protein